MRTRIIIGSRGSKLALIQAESIVSKLRVIYPSLDINVKTIRTTGDRDRITDLDRIGSNVFVKELEEALLDGLIDIAVHSLKDVPTEIPRGLMLAAVMERANPSDVLVAKSSLENLRVGSRIGTGSLRRSVQIALIRPDIETCSIRGNIETRLRKVATNEVDGIILAAAALIRMDWQEKITQYLPLDVFLPAAGQGALVVQVRSNDTDILDMITPLNHFPTWQSTVAERVFLHELGGGCRAPIAALGTITETQLKLEGMVASLDGKHMLRHSVTGKTADPSALGIQLAAEMLERGVSKYIDEARRDGNG